MSHLDKMYSLLKENNDYSVKDDFIKVLVLEPKKAPYVKEVRDTLDTWQDLVDGWIEITYPFDDDVVVVGNEEAKLVGMEGNRHINGAVYAGPIVLVGDTGYGDFRGLTDEEIAKYTEIFRTPENISDDEVQSDMGFMVFGFESKKSDSKGKKTVKEAKIKNVTRKKVTDEEDLDIKESFDIDPVKGTWLNCELSKEEAKALRQYLRDNGIKFETSGVGDDVHFEILYKNQDQVDATDRFLSNVVDGWEVLEGCGKKGKKEEKKEVKEAVDKKFLDELKAERDKKLANVKSLANLTKDELWGLRQDIRLGSLFTRDYENRFGIDPRYVQDSFDGYLDYLGEIMKEEIPRYDDNNYWDYLDEYNIPEHLDEYFNYMLEWSDEDIKAMTKEARDEIEDWYQDELYYANMSDIEDDFGADTLGESKKTVKEGTAINRNKEVWEGWTVGNFIDELEPQLDMIMRGQSWKKPFTNKEDLTKWIIDNQPYYKKKIPDVIKYFANKYHLS